MSLNSLEVMYVKTNVVMFKIYMKIYTGLKKRYQFMCLFVFIALAFRFKREILACLVITITSDNFIIYLKLYVVINIYLFNATYLNPYAIIMYRGFKHLF